MSPKYNHKLKHQASAPKTRNMTKFTNNKAFGLKSQKSYSGVKTGGVFNKTSESTLKVENRRKTMRSGDRLPCHPSNKLDTAKSRGQSKTSFCSQNVEKVDRDFSKT